jgi:hypothetical protein
MALLPRAGRRITLALLALSIAILGVAGVASAVSPYPPAPAGGTVTRSQLAPGECTLFSGSGFAPGTPVDIFDNDVKVATTTAGADGTFTQEICFGVAPSGSALRHALLRPHAVIRAAATSGAVFTSGCGTHRLGAKGTAPDGSVRVVSASITLICPISGGTTSPVSGTTNPGSSSGLPLTGIEWLLTAVAAGMALIVVGLLLTVGGNFPGGRRRAHGS